MTRGFSLLEVLIALSVLTLILLAVAFVELGIPQVFVHARLHQEAIARASRAYSREAARSEPVRNGTSTSESDGDFQVSLEKELLSDGSIMRLVSRAVWHDLHGSEHEMHLAGFLTDYAHAPYYPCSPLLIGDWEHPDTSLVPGIMPPLQALAADREYVVAIASTTVGIRDPSLFLFHAEGGGIPQLAGSYDSATSTRIGYIAVTLTPSYILALTSHACSGTSLCASLDIFPLALPLARAASYPLASARSIRYADGRAYIGLRALPAGPEFLVLDMTDPIHPVRLGSMETGSTVNDMLVDGTTAYLATADNSILGNRAVLEVDVRDPHEGMQPSAQGRPPGAGISQALAASGESIFLGRSSPLNSKELYRFRNGDLMHPEGGTDAASSITGLLARGYQLLALTRTVLLRFDTSEPEALGVLPGSYAFLAGKSASALVCGGRNVYAALNDTSSGSLLMLEGS